MDRSIIQKREQFHFLLPYYLHTMDELCKDMNIALDESSDRRMLEKQTRRSKVWKCRSHIKSKSRLILDSSVPKSSAKSEDSESSLDAWIHGQMDFSIDSSYNHGDSDNRVCNDNQVDCHLTSWRHCSPNLMESDSVNENFNPSKATRRKRKFKRMTVDPPFVTEHKSLPCDAAFTQKSKRLRNLKSPKLSKNLVKPHKLSKISVSQLSSKMENFCMEFGNAATSSGKRKRCVHERSVECTGCGCKATVSYKDSSELLKISSNPFHRLGHCHSKSQEINSSGLSSSESECGVLTNDEGREADDEQSDFFQESASACGAPNFSSWWEDDHVIPDEEDFSDIKFPEILTKSFCGLSPKKTYAIPSEENKDRRLVRAGRRRLANKMPCDTEEIFPYLPLTNEYNCFITSGDSGLTKSLLNEKKKRKGMPLSLGYEEFSAETNVDFNILKKPDSIPSIGIQRGGDEILSSNKTPANDGKQGLEFVNKDDESVISATVPMKKSC